MDLGTVILVFVVFVAWYLCVCINTEIIGKKTSRYHEPFTLVSAAAALTGPVYLLMVGVDVLFRRSVRKRRELA